jgi:peptidoglycan/xylan/chitin deacetylase (PgdA/CDA1 family)
VTASRRDRLGVRFDRDGMVKRFLASGRAGFSLAAGVALAAGGALIVGTQPVAAFAILERLTSNVLWRVETDRPLVALSFDDGPDPAHTPEVLEILKASGATATFFLIGERAAAHPGLVRRIRAEGHEVGNHYFTRGSALRHSDAEFVGSLERTERAADIARPTKLFRPPGGLAWPRQLRLARERGYSCVLGSAYPYDGAHPPVAYIRWLIEKNLEPGAIVILHDGIADPRGSIAALPRILATGRERGLRFVSIGTLMAAARR